MQRRNLQYASVNTASSGQNLLITNPSTTAMMYVWDIYLSVAAATNLSFYSGAGALTGNINLLAGAQFNPSVDAAGWSPVFIVMPNAAFNVSSTAAAQISGFFHYSN
jgi:hypothetical protein